jgi:hypothetical protein
VAGQLAAALDDGRYRRAVVADFREASSQGIEVSPHFVLPDGTAHFNPGITYREERGIPIIVSDHPSVYEDLIQVASVQE